MANDGCSLGWLVSKLTVIALVACHFIVDPANAIILAAWPAALGYWAIYATLKRCSVLGPFSSLRAANFVVACFISTASIFALADVRLWLEPLTHMSVPLSVAVAAEIGATAAALTIAGRDDPSGNKLLAHHVVLMIAMLYVAFVVRGTAVAAAVLFIETTNIGGYALAILHSREGDLHRRCSSTVYNAVAVVAIGWYVVGRFVVATPLILYFLWRTWDDSPWLYRTILAGGLPCLIVLNVHFSLTHWRTYRRCPSSWFRYDRRSAGADRDPTDCRNPRSCVPGPSSISNTFRMRKRPSTSHGSVA